MSYVKSLRLALLLLATGVATLAGADAWAVPSFSRQTGQECASCHVGGYGPALTPFGMRFKLGGYVDTDGIGTKVPLSAMVNGTFTRTTKGQEGGAAEHFKSNDNAAMQEGSLFLAGRMAEHLGVFAQATYSGIDRKLALDNVDIRSAGEVAIGQRSATIGISVNNNPTIQDPFNTLPAWSFPYVSSDLAPTPARTPMLDGGLAGRVAGASAYAFLDGGLYFEVGGYSGLRRSQLDAINGYDEADPGDRVRGLAPYGRIAYMLDMKSQVLHAGLVGMTSRQREFGAASGPSNRYTDLGADAGYMFLGDRTHVFGIGGAFVQERLALSRAFDDGEADRASQRLSKATLTATYSYAKTYGASLSMFGTRGSRDFLLNANRTGVPDTTGMIAQLDWTPFGKEDSPLAPWLNMRLGLQYTMYGKFDGARINYDGAGRNASDNDTLLAFVSFAF